MRHRKEPGFAISSVLVAQLAGCVSLAAFFFYLRHSCLLLSGDAVAHINIARRVFDSQTPGPLQLGTVWLPLPHLLMMPFLLSDWLWQTGIGGAIPSMVAYVLSTAGIFRLVCAVLSWNTQADSSATIAALAGAIIFAANPNLIYLQTTALTEPVYLVFFIWTVVFFVDFSRTINSLDDGNGSAARALVRCGLCVGAACLTRYDGWFLALLVFGAAVAVVGNRSHDLRLQTRHFRLFVLTIAVGPVLWLAYNAIVYRNPLEFANGPYSAKAIEQKTFASGAVAHPGTNDPILAARYFLKAARLNMAENRWQGIWIVLLAAGLMLSFAADRRTWPLLLLCVPVVFYALSVAYSGVPIYVPGWWPHSLYNVRYGIELLPAFAVFTALVSYYLAAFARNQIGQLVVAMALLILVAGSYASVWRAQSVCLREAWINSRSRIPLESELAKYLEKMPRQAKALAYLGDHSGAWQKAGVPLRQVINEGNHRPWKLPADSDGLWERSLREPAKYVDFVVAADGDAVALTVEKSQLTEIARIHAAGEPAITIYRTSQR